MFKQKIGTVAMLAILVVASLAPRLPVVRADEQAPAPAFDASAWEGVPTRVLMGRRCVNEGTWNVVDCATIAHIAKRLSEHDGTDLRTWLLTRHGRRSLHPERHLPSVDERGREIPRLSITFRRNGRPVTVRDDRPWIGDLNDSLAQPRMWGWRNTMRWEGRGSRYWAAILETVDGVLAGTTPDPSGGRALIWGGPRIDADAIAQRRAQGFVQIPIAGTQNHYFGRP